jgi:hypothetical protein
MEADPGRDVDVDVDVDVSVDKDVDADSDSDADCSVECLVKERKRVSSVKRRESRLESKGNVQRQRKTMCTVTSHFSLCLFWVWFLGFRFWIVRFPCS